MSEPAANAKSHRSLRGLYDWLMQHATGPRAWLALGLVSFLESWILPVVPELLLIPMVLADKKRAFMLAGLCTLTSVVGGMIGYAIGAWLYDSLGAWLISAYGYGDKLGAFRAAYAHWGAWIILIKGLTPIPYKIVTIASGFAGYDFGLFVLLSTITRGVRFYVIAGLLYVFGDPVREFIEKRLGIALLVFLAVCAAGFFVVRYLF